LHDIVLDTPPDMFEVWGAHFHSHLSLFLKWHMRDSNIYVWIKILGKKFDFAFVVFFLLGGGLNTFWAPFLSHDTDNISKSYHS
jgi:hypothetical protein